MRRHRRNKELKEAELEMTPFMNIMMVLVPVLILNMVFSHITIMNLKLPQLASNNADVKDQQLEVAIHNKAFSIYYPSGMLLREVPAKADNFDFKMLQDVLREIKRQLNDKGVVKDDIVILSEPGTDYQSIVSTMDTVRAFKTVVSASLVEAELFPQISLGDAVVPPIAVKKAGGAL